MPSKTLRSKVKKHAVRMTRNVLGKAVLAGLLITAGTAMVAAPGLTEVLRLLPRERRNPRAVIRALEQLSRKGLIILTGTRGARKALLTDHGKREAFLHSLVLSPVHKKGWDGSWFLVSFDIPAAQSKARDAFRRTMKKLGFIQYQKSLYIYPHGCESELDFLIEYYKVQDSVVYFYAADLRDESTIRKKFGL